MKVRCNPLIIIVAAIVGVIAASFIFAQWGNSNEILKRTAVMSIMISLITVSTVLMICLILLKSLGYARSEQKVSSRELLQEYGFEQILPQLVFGFGAVIQAVLQIPGTLDCVSVFNHEHLSDRMTIVTHNDTMEFLPPPAHDRLDEAMDEVHQLYQQLIPYAFLKALFLTLQIVICCKYPKAHITVAGKIWFTQIVAAAVLTTNLAIYLTTIVRESKERIGDYSDIDEHDLEPLPEDSMLRECLMGETKLQEKLGKFEHYFFPFLLEFSLSSISPLCSLAMNNTPSHSGDSSSVGKNDWFLLPTTENGQQLAEQPSSHLTVQSAENIQSAQSSGQSGQSSAQNGQSSGQSALSQSSIVSQFGSVYGFNIAGIMIAFFLWAMLGVSGLTWSLSAGHIEIPIELITRVGELLLIGVINLVAAAACLFLMRYSTKNLRLNSHSAALIILCIMYVAGHLLKIIPVSAILGKGSHVEITEAVRTQANLFTATYALDMFQVLCQTVLLGYLVNHHLELNITGFQRRLFMVLLQFLGMSNFMGWIYGSFIAPRLSYTAPWNAEFFSSLVQSVINQFSLPFALFFRFFSMHIILKAHHKIKWTVPIGASRPPSRPASRRPSAISAVGSA